MDKAEKAHWFINRKTDIFFILLAGPTISMALLWGIWHGPAFLILAALFALCLDIPHVLHTYLALWADPTEFKRHQKPFWWGLGIIGGLCTVAALMGQLVLLVTVWVLWQPYHVCKQHFGVATLYARKAGYQGSTQIVKWLVLSGFAAPLVYRWAHGGFQFGHYELMGFTLPFSGMTVLDAHLPTWTPWPLYAVFAAFTMAFIWQEWSRVGAGRALPKFVWVMLAVSLALYNAAYILVSDLYALILIGTSIHAIQYHLVCVATVKQRVNKIPLSQNCGVLGSLQAWVHRLHENPKLWMGSLLLASIVVLATEFPSLGAIPLTIVLHHFYLDGVIWKRKP